MTGGRIKRIAPYIDDDIFMVTYGDGLTDVDLPRLIDYHQSHKGIATVTAIQPKGRFGILNLNDSGMVEGFIEKPENGGSWINGGYMVMDRKIFDYISGDNTELERHVLIPLSANQELFAYKHHGFWHPMDTIWDKTNLEQLYYSGKARWIRW